MSSWTGVLDLQRRSRRNALRAAAQLRRRRAASLEAGQATEDAAGASLVDGAHHEPPRVAMSPESELESRYHPADRLVPFDG
jgi:hypothetical protein